MSINHFLDKKMKTNLKINLVNDDLLDNESLNLEKEFEYIEKKIIKKNHPKNYGNIWTTEERNIILKQMKKNNYNNQTNLYDEEIITKIATKLERTEYAVKEEIKKMIYNDYLTYLNYNLLNSKYNIPESYIKLLIKIYLEKNGKKIIESIQLENNILKNTIENIKLKRELEELKK